ncbi:hypothetical protein BMMON2_12000 [Burkholderia mallei]
MFIVSSWVRGGRRGARRFVELREALEQRAGGGEQLAFAGGEAGVHRAHEPFLALRAVAVQHPLAARGQRHAALAAVGRIRVALDQPAAFELAQQRGEIRRAHPLGRCERRRRDVTAEPIDRAEDDQLRELHGIGLRLPAQAPVERGDLAAQAGRLLKMVGRDHGAYFNIAIFL